jgi:plastocyanin
MPTRFNVFGPISALAAGLILASPRPVIAQAKDSGVIAGKIVFKGKPPAQSPLAMTGDCTNQAGARDQSVVVGDGGLLAGVHVRIKSGTAGAHAVPASPVTIEQKGCVYTPRVIGGMEGQEVWITNGDPTMHNVHAYAGKKTLFNRPQPSGAKPIKHTKIGKAGEVFTLKCDVHPWMIAFVPITDHPFFQITGADGAFELTAKVGDRALVFEFPRPEP